MKRLALAVALLGLVIVVAVASGRFAELANLLPGPLKALVASGPDKPQGGAGQGGGPGGGGRPVPVFAAKAQSRQMPVLLDAIGTVQAVSSVVLRPRVDSQVLAVHVADGAAVKEGDLLITLDARQIEALLRQAEGQMGRDAAQLEAARRDVVRYTALAEREVTSRQKLDDSRTAAKVAEAQLRASTAAVDNLKVQLGFTEVRAPISGRLGLVTQKVGNVVRAAETASPLATIQQMSPVYVAFAVPQRQLTELATAWRNPATSIEISVPGSERKLTGKPAMLDNSVDIQSGTITARAQIENPDELLWPGALVNVRATLRTEEAIALPATAVMQGQGGSYVYVVKDGQAKSRPIQVSRTIGAEAAVAKGLEAGETVVVDGQLRLTEGSRVELRERRAGP